MPRRAPCRALSVVLILLWAHPRTALACPHPCACYVPSEVHCTFRSLAAVPAGISPHVERINLGFNSIQALSETSFAGLTNLELLMVHGNNIPSIPDGALKDLSSLQVFKFSYNKLRVITGQTLQGLWSLMRLHMDHNKIEFIHPQAFKGLMSLRLLHLEGNLLHQVHAGTFSTFTFLDYFRLSNIRHVYLAENKMRALPAGVLQSMPLLENLYLQGNPWSCDCEMAWFLQWDAKSKGILKCKKDKAYEGGQLCAMCSSPKKLHKQEIHKLKHIPCLKPSIESPLRHNSSGSGEDDEETEDDTDGQLSLERFQLPPWNISLNMTDEHGNVVSLACDIKKPTEVHKIHLNQTDSQELEINATVALDFECAMTRENYEKLWKLIAYYSEVPVRLHREAALSQDSGVAYHYRQDAADDTLYYTGVRAHIQAEPEWVMQPSIDLQLNRRQSTAKKVLLSYYSQHSLTMSGKDAEQSRSRSWVMIEPSGAVQRAQTVLEGAPCQLSCNVKASESPSIFWVLPDGSVLKAPMEDKNGKVSILTSGWLKIKSTEQSDSGLYQCIAQVRDEMDRMVYRVLVQTPATQAPDGHTVKIQKNPGEPVTLPCHALAVPEAQLSWILPNKRILNDLTNTSHAYMLADGTLSIPKVQVSDSGYYKCVAVNQQGADDFTVGVTVSKKGSGRSSKRGRRPGGKTPSRLRGDIVEDEGGSGVEDEDNASRRILHPKDHEMFIQTKDDAVPGGKKGRRKPKPWKNSGKEPETTIAEGRRVFESRRKINMASKQINPEHWADILARVRGKNLPKGTEVPGVTDTTPVATTVPAQKATSPSVPPTHPSRKRPNERRRLRPHKFRLRNKQTPPTTFAPTETFSDPPTRAPEVKTPSKAQSSPVPTSWVESTVGTPKQLEMRKQEEPVSKGTPRRKHGRRPNKHRYSTSTASSATSASKLSPSSDKQPKNTITPSPETAAFSTAISLETAHPRQITRVEDSMATPTNISVSPDTFQETLPGTHTLASAGKEMKTNGVTGISDNRTDGLVPAESVINVVSTSGSEVSTVGEFKETSPPSGFPGAESWNPPRTAQPGRLQTDAAATSSPETLTDRSSSKESEDLEFSSEVSPSVAASTLFPQEGQVSSTTLSSMDVESSSSRAGTISGQGHQETPPAIIRPEMRPPNQVPTPAPMEEPASPLSHTTLMSVVQTTTTKPTPRTSRASPSSAESKENVFFNYVGIPETKTPPAHNEGTQHIWRPNGLSTPSPDQDGFKLTPNKELGREAFDGKTQNLLPRGPDRHPQGGRVHGFHQPAKVPALPVPPRGTVRPPHMTTQNSFRHVVTVQPPRHLTNKAEVTAYPPSRALPKHHHVTTPKFSSTSPPVVPWRGSKVNTPSKPPDQGADRWNGNPNVFGNNYIPDLRDPVGKLPSPRVPQYSNGRLPLFSNRTLSFPQLGVTQKPPTPTSPAPAMAERKVNPGTYPRIHSQSISHGDLGPPAPPFLHHPRSTAPPSTNVQNIPLLYSTRSSVPFVTASGQPSRSFHQSGSKLFSAGGPPASKFWTLGEKPQIITKSPQTVSVTAETDVVFPCEATGKPKPFVTWTKVSTGALMTPNTRVQRFEVLKNGTFVIRKVQVQDRGQYMCVAKNLHGVDRMVVVLSVSVQQPQILASHYQDVTVYLGDTIAMECLAKGTPVPQISWIFPDRRVWQTVSPVEGRVTLHENRTLSIKEASFADRGVYQCVASNAAGADSLAIRLHVAALPPVIQQEKLENISLPPGLSIHIHCSAKAAPQPSVRWVLGDGTQVRPSQFLHGNLFVFPNGTLYIRNLAPKDSGRYECVAANLVGSARRTVQLTVQRAAANARITGTSPQRTNVHYGGTLRLDCSASGDPWPRILWRLPSKRMIDALFSFDTRVKVFANGTLVVKSVTDKDAGDYLCVARNKVGDDFVMLKVNVVMKPAKIEHKEENDHRVFYGSDLKVDCVATGLPNPEIFWSVPDGSLVNSFMQSDDSGGRTKRYVVFNNGTLYFNEVGMREEGDYTCFAENQVGKDEMTVRVKVVTEPAAIRNKTYSMVQVPYGDVVTVACEAKGEPTPRVTWLSPTNRLIPTSSEKYQIYQDGTLLIQKAQRSDSGNYTCVVRNSAGEDRKVVWIHVNVQSPKINGNPDAITTVREIAAGGSRKLIDCLAEGVPTPRVLWAFPEGVVLPAPYYGNRVTIHRNGTLDIRSLRKSDSVQLACIGRNEGGEARLIVQLTVLEPLQKPTFHDPVNEKITAMAGHTISLNCSAAGTPTPTLLWVLPNGTELQSGQRVQRFYHKSDGMLHISGLSSADAGAYRCVARNAAGHTERLVSLKVGLKPEASQQYHNLVSIINGETLQLHCLPAAGRQARLSWTLPNGVTLQDPQTRGRVSIWENGTLTVREASVFDRGTYVCKTDTEFGSSVMNFPVIVIAYPPRITSEPTPVIYTRPGNTVKMNCMAMGIPKAEITWELPDRSHLTAGPQARLYGNRFLHPQGSLTIQQATHRDMGFYKCTAKNILGTDSKTTYIHVY
ncbi:PREDICTED: matrix-remodeling-associated protein 5 [Hipposideros armiger]|uniref:Matrix-remodeling-associated protein 5 n=1 Tax=Hipposideros armiger TaxID=186990 RepID=A0A8B7Q1G2_HIPAR|nr:PREDICTED: matrix-remodeling-associated protein 5 [Hipposideros armiger]